MSRAEKIEKALAMIERAFAEVSRVCYDRWNGKDGWRTTIPADKSRDTDIIICDALHAAREVIGALPPDEPARDAVAWLRDVLKEGGDDE